jgi:hypothetical protein
MLVALLLLPLNQQKSAVIRYGVAYGTTTADNCTVLGTVVYSGSFFVPPFHRPHTSWETPPTRFTYPYAYQVPSIK